MKNQDPEISLLHFQTQDFRVKYSKVVKVKTKKELKGKK